MTATPTPAPPRNFAAEFAALMAEQADLTRRAYRLMEEASRHQPAPPMIDADPRREAHVTATITVGTAKAPDRGTTKPFDAAGEEIKLNDPAAWKPDAPLAAEVREPREDPAMPPATKSRRDLVLDLYGSTTMTTTEMAEHLNLGQSTIQGTIVGTRRSGDPRIVKGDAARLALRRATNPEPAPKPSAPAASMPQQDPAATARTAVPHLAPAPRAPQKREAKPASAAEPLPAPRTPAEHKARADARARVLRHYGETGDYEGQIAQKLGYLRAWVVAFIDEARREKDPRVTVGDGRRRLRERAA